MNFPKLRVSLGAGDLIDVYDVNLSVEDSRKLVATLRANPAGWTGGAVNATVTFKSAMSEDGYEREYWKKWRSGDELEMRMKLPGVTLVIKGPLTKPSVAGNVDNFIDSTFSIIGKLSPE